MALVGEKGESGWRKKEIKYPFKRNGLPCCEDEPGSEKIALNFFVLYANERYTKWYANKLKCINFTKYKTKDKSLSFSLHLRIL